VDRLFVAVWPDAAVRDALAAIDRPASVGGAGVRWTTPDQWHVTLRFLGQASVAEAEAAFAGAAGLLPSGPVVAQMDAAARRYGRTIGLAVHGLESVAAAVLAATASVGEPAHPRRFTGHITLARTRRDRPRGGLREVGLDAPVSWTVPEIALVRSHLHPDGARYETVAVLPVP
jgi:2'-5' RNA ligase